MNVKKKQQLLTRKKSQFCYQWTSEQFCKNKPFYEAEKNRKLTFKFIQVPLSIFTLLINLYCLCVFSTDKNTRSLEYSMVFLQTVNDFVFSGLFGSAYYIYKLRSSSMRSCSGVFHEYAERFQQEAGIPNLKQDVSICLWIL